MKESVILESSDVRQIIACFLGIPIEQVIPSKYSYAVSGISSADIAYKLKEGILDANSHF